MEMIAGAKLCAAGSGRQTQHSASSPHTTLLLLRPPVSDGRREEPVSQARVLAPRILCDEHTCSDSAGSAQGDTFKAPIDPILRGVGVAPILSRGLAKDRAEALLS